jgi:hypothetical protein
MGYPILSLYLTCTYASQLNITHARLSSPSAYFSVALYCMIVQLQSPANVPINAM